MMFLQNFILLSSLFFGFCICEKILVYNPDFAHSHYQFMNKLSDVLAEQGHNVTVLIPEKAVDNKFGPKKANVWIIKTRIVNPGMDNVQDHLWADEFEFLQTYRVFRPLSAAIKRICDDLFSNTAVIDQIKSENYDFGFLEAMDVCGFGLFKLAGIDKYAVETPMTLSGSFMTALGLAGRSYANFPMDLDDHPKLGFIERVDNFLQPALLYLMNLMTPPADIYFNPAESIGHARVVFSNSEEHIDFSRQITHKVHYIGGITVDTSSTHNLTAEYKQIFEDGKKVVLVSFGSLVKSSLMPANYRKSLVEMFEAFPHVNFIWKYENPNDTVADHLPNVFKLNWVNQKLVLSQPNTAAFVSHGGMNSVLEAAHFGVPLMAIPVFADQKRNVKMLEHRQTAVIVHKTAMADSGKLIEVLGEILEDKNGFKSRAQRLAQIIREKPVSAEQRFIKYFNHALRTRDDVDFHDYEFRKFSLIKYYNLDVYLAIVSVLAVPAIFIYYFTVFLYHQFLRKSKIE